MNILLVMIPLSLLLLGAAIWAFVWAVRRGQFDDLDGAAMRILIDDETKKPSPAEDGEKRPAIERPASTLADR